MNLIDKNLYPNCFKAFQYAEDIIAEEIASCWQVKASCERFKRDLNDKRFYMDIEAAERVCRLVQQFPHIKGSLANKPLILEPWQLFIFVNVFGFKWNVGERKGLRRFQKILNLVARKNGKTALSAPVGLYMLALDGEEGPEIYSLATKKDQARLVFDSSKEMAKRTKGYIRNTGVQTYAHTIKQPTTAGEYKPLASDSNSSDGFNPHLVIFDEVHAFKDRNMFGVMETAIGARSQPLLWSISTAGFDTSGICHELQIDLEKILKREYDDETQFGMIYTLDPDDDFRDETNWIKANPNLDISVSRDYIRGMVDKAIRQPSNKNNILTKHFNIWCNAASAFFDMLKWKKCEDKTIKMEDFKGKKAMVGLDIASKTDIATSVYCFKIPATETSPSKYVLFDNSYLPEAAIESSLNAAYKGWVEEGWLIKTPGEAISLQRIEDDIKANLKDRKNSEVLYDPWNAVQISQNLTKDRIETVEVKMNTANLSNPMKHLDALIREGRIIHNGSPVFNWCMANVLSKEDNNGNHYPRKSHEKFKIDIAVGAIIAIAGWIQEETTKKDSVYKSRGVRTLM